MQNRLTAVKESRETQQKQLSEIQATVEAEKVARPDSVRRVHYYDGEPSRTICIIGRTGFRVGKIVRF